MYQGCCIWSMWLSPCGCDITVFAPHITVLLPSYWLLARSDVQSPWFPSPSSSHTPDKRCLKVWRGDIAKLPLLEDFHLLWRGSSKVDPRAVLVLAQGRQGFPNLAVTESADLIIASGNWEGTFDGACNNISFREVLWLLLSKSVVTVALLQVYVLVFLTILLLIFVEVLSIKKEGRECCLKWSA